LGRRGIFGISDCILLGKIAESRIVQVEDTLFKVPRQQFLQSPIFKTTFTLPAGESNAEGLSDDCPFQLQGVTKAAFESLLQIMYPLTLSVFQSNMIFR
jgi:hypothetical protein